MGHGYWEGRVVLWRRVNNNVAQDSKLALTEPASKNLILCLDEKPEKALNGEDKGDSGVDTQNSEGNADEEDPLGPNCYYDKSKSFFDNISCDDMRLVLILWFAKISSKFHLYFLSFIFFSVFNFV